MKNIWKTKLKTENEEIFWNDGLRRNTKKRIHEESWENGQDLRETLLRSSDVENEDEKCHENCWALRNEELKGWTNDEQEFENDLGEGMWLMGIILTSHFKKNSPENKKSQVRSWEKTCGLGPTQKKSPLKKIA